MMCIFPSNCCFILRYCSLISISAISEPCFSFSSSISGFKTFIRALLNSTIVAGSVTLLSLLVGSFATLTMLTKNSFLDEIRKQYVLTARMKGLSERQVLYGHVFRNAMLIVIAGFPGAFVSAFPLDSRFGLDRVEQQAVRLPLGQHLTQQLGRNVGRGGDQLAVAGGEPVGVHGGMDHHRGAAVELLDPAGVQVVACLRFSMGMTATLDS